MGARLLMVSSVSLPPRRLLGPSGGWRRCGSSRGLRGSGVAKRADEQHVDAAVVGTQHAGVPGFGMMPTLAKWLRLHLWRRPFNFHHDFPVAKLPRANITRPQAIVAEMPCMNCGHDVGHRLMREAIVRWHRLTHFDLGSIARGQIKDEYVRVNSIGGGGFVCATCHRKYCAKCGGQMSFRCCGTTMLIGTDYLLD